MESVEAEAAPQLPTRQLAQICQKRLKIVAHFRLVDGLDIVLQPFGSFLSLRSDKVFDVANSAATAVVLKAIKPTSLDAITNLLATRGKNYQSSSIAMVDWLFEKGFAEPVVNTTTDFAKISIDDRRDIPKITRAEIELTNRCNLKCLYCYAEVNRSKFELTADEWIEILKGMTENGLRAVLFSGGEPFIRKDILEILKYASKDLLVEVNTNGYYITENMADELALLDLMRIQISLDSVEPDHHDSIRGKGSHKAAVTAIKRLTDRDIPVQISAVITRNNAHDVKALERFAEELGAIFKSDIVTRTGFAREIDDEIWKSDYSDREFAKTEVSKRPKIPTINFMPMCQSQLGFVAVSFHGILKPCNMREGFFDLTPNALLEKREAKWWEHPYGSTNLAKSVLPLKPTSDEERSVVAAEAKKYVCDLQASALVAGLN